ncbi:dTMP kinase [bacterium]|nr:dTMP kinase [bacterium]|tara:strand:+ start:15850 stop:16482 length:633 start_codon:yes stop_codon:yes gene_type:complete
MTTKKGTFIVIDGGEGSGTTTVAKEIVQKFGWGAVYTREPGGSPYAEKIRELVLSDDAKTSDVETQFALFWAARRDHIKKTIAPALAEGKVVICDRFDSSTYAYQLIAQEQVQLIELFWKIREHFLGEYVPNVYVLLDVSPETGIARAKGRNEDLNHFDKRKIDFHKSVNKGLKEFVITKAEHGSVVDAEQPLEKVIEDTMVIVQERLTQ